MPTLAILKLDQIGDYVVFRNFIKEIKNSKKYAGYKIVLICNEVCVNLAKELDGEYIDKVIGINKRSYRKYGIYRGWMANEINAQKIDVLISPTYSRDAQWVENLVKSINAKEKIGSSGDGTNITLGQKKEADRRYTQLIKQVEKPLFEFDRYKEFFEKLLGKKFSAKVPSIDLPDVDKTRLVGFFPSAGAKYRRWSTSKFAELADFIKENFGYKICLLGDKKDRKIAKEIMKKSSADFINMAGCIKLGKLPAYCKKMQFVVTNDTSGLHISAAVGTKTLCISNGNTYPRFVEYPNKDVVKVVYSDTVEKNLSDSTYVRENLLYGSNFDINDVTVEKVIENLIKLTGVKVKKTAKTSEKTTAKTVKKTATKKTTAKKADKVASKTVKAEPKKAVKTVKAAAKKAEKATATKATAKKTATKTAKVATKTATVKATAKKTAAKKPVAKKTTVKATVKKTTKKEGK